MADEKDVTTTTTDADPLEKFNEPGAASTPAGKDVKEPTADDKKADDSKTSTSDADKKDDAAKDADKGADDKTAYKETLPPAAENS